MPMRIIAAPDSFKGSLTALEAAECIEAGVKKAVPDAHVIKIPISDGGEGFVLAMTAACGGKIINTTAMGPLMNKAPAYFGVIDDDTAVIEMAVTSGLALLSETEMDPLLTTTYGVGELIGEACSHGYRKIILGIGGSATNDGGMGMAQALGVKFYGKSGNLLGQGGKFLCEVDKIDMSSMNIDIKSTEIKVACDVKNPLCGEYGAANVYGPQKGAVGEAVTFLDNGLRNFAEVILRDLAIDILNIPGSGAAGGLGGGLIAFAGAVLRPGIEIVLDACHFENAVKNAGLVITGEGLTDEQTCYGKAPVGVAAVAKKYGAPVVCLSGALGHGYEKVFEQGIDAAFSIIDNAMTLKQAMNEAGCLLTQAACNIARLYRATVV